MAASPSPGVKRDFSLLSQALSSGPDIMFHIIPCKQVLRTMKKKGNDNITQHEGGYEPWQ
jgi:hypothetical protein